MSEPTTFCQDCNSSTNGCCWKRSGTSEWIGRYAMMALGHDPDAMRRAAVDALSAEEGA